MNDMKICKDKECNKKGEPQPLDNFYANKLAVMGRTPKCKECTKRIKHEKYYNDKKIENREGLPPARYSFALKNLVNEQIKLLKANEQLALMHRVDNWECCQTYAGVYIEECEQAINKIKGLLMIPL